MNRTTSLWPHISRRLFSTSIKEITIPASKMGEEDRAAFTLKSKASPYSSLDEEKYNLPVHVAFRFLKGLNCQISVSKYISSCHVPHVVTDFKIMNKNGEFLCHEEVQSVDLAAQKVSLFLDSEGNLQERKIR